MVDPDIVAVARIFVRRHGDRAAARLREVAAQHAADWSEDAAFWAAVADMAEAICFDSPRCNYGVE